MSEGANTDPTQEAEKPTQPSRKRRKTELDIIEEECFKILDEYSADTGENQLVDILKEELLDDVNAYRSHIKERQRLKRELRAVQKKIQDIKSNILDRKLMRSDVHQELYALEVDYQFKTQDRGEIEKLHDFLSSLDEVVEDSKGDQGGPGTPHFLARESHDESFTSIDNLEALLMSLASTSQIINSLESISKYFSAFKEVLNKLS